MRYNAQFWFTERMGLTLKTCIVNHGQRRNNCQDAKSQEVGANGPGEKRLHWCNSVMGAVPAMADRDGIRPPGGRRPQGVLGEVMMIRAGSKPSSLICSRSIPYNVGSMCGVRLRIQRYL